MNLLSAFAPTAALARIREATKGRALAWTADELEKIK